MKNVTAALILVAPFLVLVYDVLAYRIGGHDATITGVIQGWAKDFKELPAIMGAVLVWFWLHFFLVGLVENVKDCINKG